jgi:DnaK suppressor protein
VNAQHYRERLQAQDHELSTRIAHAMLTVREPRDGAAHDVGDDSAAGEVKEEQFAETDRDRHVLQQVRDALGRLDAGTFGTCAVDGGPIEPERLEAMPWTPLCLTHQRLLEGAVPPRTPTL